MTHMNGRYLVIAVAAGLVAGGLLTNAAAQRAALAAPPHAAAVLPPARVALVIVPGVRLGPDGKMHDAFTPTAVTALVGQRLILTVYNYDRGRHSITAPALHLNALIAAAKRTGVPSVTVVRVRVG